jgi:predicted DNA-binding antitoxin AbrB/MazE fold protein
MLIISSGVHPSSRILPNAPQEIGSKIDREQAAEAVYENGVLRPLQPLGLRDQQHVMVTVSEIPNYQAWAKDQLREIGPAPNSPIERRCPKRRRSGHRECLKR